MRLGEIIDGRPLIQGTNYVVFHIRNNGAEVLFRLNPGHYMGKSWDDSLTFAHLREGVWTSRRHLVFIRSDRLVHHSSIAEEPTGRYRSDSNRCHDEERPWIEALQAGRSFTIPQGFVLSPRFAKHMNTVLIGKPVTISQGANTWPNVDFEYVCTGCGSTEICFFERPIYINDGAVTISPVEVESPTNFPSHVNPSDLHSGEIAILHALYARKNFTIPKDHRMSEVCQNEFTRALQGKTIWIQQSDNPQIAVEFRSTYADHIYAEPVKPHSFTLWYYNDGPTTISFTEGETPQAEQTANKILTIKERERLTKDHPVIKRLEELTGREIVFYQDKCFHVGRYEGLHPTENRLLVDIGKGGATKDIKPFDPAWGEIKIFPNAPEINPGETIKLVKSPNNSENEIAMARLYRSHHTKHRFRVSSEGLPHDCDVLNNTGIFSVLYTDGYPELSFSNLAIAVFVILTGDLTIQRIEDSVTITPLEGKVTSAAPGTKIALNTWSGVDELKKLKEGTQFRFKGWNLLEGEGLCTFNRVEHKADHAVLHYKKENESDDYILVPCDASISIEIVSLP